MRSIFFLFLLFIFSACNEFNNDAEDSGNVAGGRKLPSKMEYSYDCLSSDSGNISDMLGKAGNLINKVATFNIEVTDKEQMKYGDTFLIEALKDKNFVIDTTSPEIPKLQTILANLVKARVKPTDIQYQIYLVDDTATINAYTVGGKVFITSAMLKKCSSDDQLYAIIGHEIGHNEKGHIKSSLKQLKASNKFFGEWGESFFAIKKLLTGSFNHKNELEADYFGLDLAWKLGYDICAIRSFWDDMAKGEERNTINDFLNTHPYSDTRSKCLVNHIKKNFKVDCN